MDERRRFIMFTKKNLPPATSLVIAGLALAIIVITYGMKFRNHSGLVFDFFNAFGPFSLSFFLISAVSATAVAAWAIAMFIELYDDWRQS